MKSFRVLFSFCLILLLNIEEHLTCILGGGGGGTYPNTGYPNNYPYGNPPQNASNRGQVNQMPPRTGIVGALDSFGAAIANTGRAKGSACGALFTGKIFS